MKRLPAASAAWAWFLDVDGTLIEFAATPDTITVDRALLALICDLHRCSGGALALVSGRSLADLDCRLGMPHLPIAGQHGLERRDAYGHIHRHSLSPILAESFVAGLAPLLARHPGLRIENKGATLAVHYRQVPRIGGYLRRLLGAMVAEAEGLQLQPGKRVLEVKPGGYDKGSAIEEFMAQPPFSGRKPVFIGDDLTDEYGFAVVNRLDGISVKVGPGPTRARFRLPNVDAVHDWLNTMTTAETAAAKEKE